VDTFVTHSYIRKIRKSKVMFTTFFFNDISNIHSLIILNRCMSIFLKWNLHKRMRHTLISSNKIMNTKNNVKK